METKIITHNLWYNPEHKLHHIMGVTRYMKKHIFFTIWGQEWSLIYHCDDMDNIRWRWGLRRNDDDSDPIEFDHRNEALDYMYRMILKLPRVI